RLPRVQARRDDRDAEVPLAALGAGGDDAEEGSREGRPDGEAADGDPAARGADVGVPGGAARDPEAERAEVPVQAHSDEGDGVDAARGGILRAGSRRRDRLAACAAAGEGGGVILDFGLREKLEVTSSPNPQSKISKIQNRYLRPSSQQGARCSCPPGS